MWEAQYYRHDYPNKLITSGGLGTMGFALPAALGARFACPNEEIWVIAGDGGFQMTQAELQTFAQEGKKRQRSYYQQRLPRAWCVNGSSSSMRVDTWQPRWTSPDFVKLAEAHGPDRGFRGHQAQ